MRENRLETKRTVCCVSLLWILPQCYGFNKLQWLTEHLGVKKESGREKQGYLHLHNTLCSLQPPICFILCTWKSSDNLGNQHSFLFSFMVTKREANWHNTELIKDKQVIFECVYTIQYYVSRLYDYTVSLISKFTLCLLGKRADEWCIYCIFSSVYKKNIDSEWKMELDAFGPSQQEKKKLNNKRIN